MEELQPELPKKEQRKFEPQKTPSSIKEEDRAPFTPEGISAQDDFNITLGCVAIADGAKEDVDICYTRALAALRRGDKVNFDENLKEPTATPEAKALFEALQDTGAVAIARMQSGKMTDHRPLQAHEIAVSLKGETTEHIFSCSDGMVWSNKYPRKTTFDFIDWVKQNAQPKN